MKGEKHFGKILVGIFVLALLLLINSSSSSNGGHLNDLLQTSEPTPVAPVEVEPTKLENLETEMASFIDTIPAHMTFVIRDLGTDETVSINNDRSYVSASLYKLFVAYNAYGEIDSGNISFNTLLSNGQTLEGCLELMITVSDNECGELLGDRFGWANIDTKIHAAGFTGTFLNQRNTPTGDFATTPSDIDLYFSMLYSGELLSQVNTDHMIDLLLRQKVNDRLPLALPLDAVFAHKTGDVYNYIHDAGIIFTRDGDYSYVMMSSQWADSMLFGPGYDYFMAMFNIIFYNI